MRKWRIVCLVLAVTLVIACASGGPPPPESSSEVSVVAPEEDEGSARVPVAAPPSTADSSQSTEAAEPNSYPVVQVVPERVETVRTVPELRDAERAIVVIADGSGLDRLDPEMQRVEALQLLLGRSEPDRLVAFLPTSLPNVGLARRPEDLRRLVREAATRAEAISLDRAVRRVTNTLVQEGIEEAEILILAAPGRDVADAESHFESGYRFHVVSGFNRGEQPPQLYFLASFSHGSYSPATGSFRLLRAILRGWEALRGDVTLFSGVPRGSVVEIPIDASIARLEILAAWSERPGVLRLAGPEGAAGGEMVPIEGTEPASRARWITLENPREGRWHLEIDEASTPPWILVAGRTPVVLLPPSWPEVLERGSVEIPVILGSPRQAARGLTYRLTRTSPGRGPMILQDVLAESGQWAVELSRDVLEPGTINCIDLRAEASISRSTTAIQRESRYCGFLVGNPEPPAPSRSVDLSALRVEMPALVASYRHQLQDNLILTRGTADGIKEGMHCVVYPRPEALPAYEGFISSARPSSSVCTVTRSWGSAGFLDPSVAEVRVEDIAFVGVPSR